MILIVILIAFVIIIGIAVISMVAEKGNSINYYKIAKYICIVFLLAYIIYEISIIESTINQVKTIYKGVEIKIPDGLGIYGDMFKEMFKALNVNQKGSLPNAIMFVVNKLFPILTLAVLSLICNKLGDE